MPTKKKSPNLAKPTWKDIQSKTRKSKRNKLALIVLALVAGLLILSWTIQLTQNLFSPWKLSVKEQRNYIWNAQFNINLLFRTNHISIFSYNPKEERVVIINIPDNTFLEVPFGFGSWQLRAVYELGESQKEGEGYKLLIDTLTSFLAIPIDGFLDLSGLKPSKTAAEVVDSLRKNPFSGFDILPVLKTNLTVWELLRLKLSLGTIRFDKVKELDLDKLNVLEMKNLPDGTVIFTADPVKLDSVLSDLADPAVTSEHLSVAVFNTTERTQLAQKAARLITNLGGNVIITANAEEALKKTKLQGVESATLRRLKQIFDFNDKISSQDEEVASSRAQINLWLGEDYVK